MPKIVDMNANGGTSPPRGTLPAIPALPKTGRYTPQYDDPYMNFGYELTNFLGRSLFGEGDQPQQERLPVSQVGMDDVYDRVKYTPEGFMMDMGDGNLAPLDASDLNAMSGVISRHQDQMKLEGKGGKATESRMMAKHLATAMLDQVDLPDDLRAAYDQASEVLTPEQLQMHLQRSMKMLEETGVADVSSIKALEEDTYKARSKWLSWETEQLQTEFDEIVARRDELSDLLRQAAEQGTTAEYANQIKRERLRLQQREEHAHLQRIAIHESTAAQRPPGAPFNVEEADAMHPQWAIGQRIKEIVVSEWTIDGIPLPNIATGERMDEFIESMNDKAVALGWNEGMFRKRTPGEMMMSQMQAGQPGAPTQQGGR